MILCVAMETMEYEQIFRKKDWKIFRSKIAGWQEAYMNKLNNEYMAILSGEENASEKVLEARKKLKRIKKDCGVQCEMSRSNQFLHYAGTTE